MTIPQVKKEQFIHLSRLIFWFLSGALIGFFFFASFIYIFYRHSHNNLIYEGVAVNNINFSGKSQEDVRAYFAQKNKFLKETTITLTDPQVNATISAKQIGFGYDENLLSEQAMSVGRSENTLSDMSTLIQAYISGINLKPSYHYKESILNSLLASLSQKIDQDPVNGLFTFEGGRVTAFKLSSDGRKIDLGKLKTEILESLSNTVDKQNSQAINLPIPIVVVKPDVSTDKINNLGIKELIGEGTSLFYHSIENRIFNINLAASRLNGILVAPGEIFSFDNALGDVSSFTGYKQAYVIQNGKTVLGDGGGVCQVSTTMFRAALHAGLPIIERNQHAYRVGYYEEDSPPGVDAVIYSPTVDFKFKNDTQNYILIQSYVDLSQDRLTFDFYGTLDNRNVVINTPVILSETPAPPPLFQDDPTLPKGTIKQVDFAAGGANVYFTRTVTKDGKVLLSDKFVSNYRPWQAVYLRGTQ